MKKLIIAPIILFFVFNLSAQKFFSPTEEFATKQEHIIFSNLHKAEAKKRASMWKVPHLTVQIIATVQSGAGAQEGYNYGAVLPVYQITKYPKFSKTGTDGLILCSKKSRGFEAIAIALNAIKAKNKNLLKTDKDYLQFIFGSNGELASMASEAEKAYLGITNNEITLSPQIVSQPVNQKPLNKIGETEILTPKTVSPSTPTSEFEESEEMKKMKARIAELEEKERQAELAKKDAERKLEEEKEFARLEKQRMEEEKRKREMEITKSEKEDKKPIIQNVTSEPTVVEEKTNSITKTSSNIPEPDFNARPYFLNGENLKNLERREATVDVKTKALGYGGASVYYTVFKPEATVKFDQKQLPRFFIKLNKEIDPEENILIVKAEVLNKNNKKKGRRRFIKQSNKLGGKARDLSDSRIQYSIKKIRDGVYEIIFDKGLDIGEYAFMPTMDGTMSSASIKLSCFGIRGENQEKKSQENNQGKRKKVINDFQTEDWLVSFGGTAGTFINSLQVGEYYDLEDFSSISFQKKYIGIFGAMNKPVPSTPSLWYGATAELGAYKNDDLFSIYSREKKLWRLYFNVGADIGYAINLNEDNGTKLVLGLRGSSNLSPKTTLKDSDGDIAFIETPERLGVFGFGKLMLNKLNIEVFVGGKAKGVRIGYNLQK